MNKEMKNIEKEVKNTTRYDVREEDEPGAILPNEFGEYETYKNIEGKYVPLPEAEVIFQKRRLLREYSKLKEVEAELEKYSKKKKEKLKLYKKVKK